MRLLLFFIALIFVITMGGCAPDEGPVYEPAPDDGVRDDDGSEEPADGFMGEPTGEVDVSNAILPDDDPPFEELSVPGDLPIFPDAELFSYNDRNGEVVFTYFSDATADEICNYYLEALEQYGFVVSKSNCGESEAFMEAEKEGISYIIEVETETGLTEMRILVKN